MDKVAIIIVNWNTGSLLSRCIESLQALPECSLISKLIIVDNDSHDSSLKQARAVTNKSLVTEFIELKENIGFARANIAALEQLKTFGPFDDHVLLLNPDTIVKPGALKAMTTALERHDHVGIVGPTLLNADGTIQHSVRRFPKLSTFIYTMLKLHRLLPKSQIWQEYLQTKFDYSSEIMVDQVMGAAFLIRDRVFTDVGFLDPIFWVWFEEVDYCKRAYLKGWHTLYTPTGQVVHYGGASFNQLVGWRKSFPWIVSSWHYANKHLGVWSGLVILLLAPIAILLSIPAAFVHLFMRHKNTKNL